MAYINGKETMFSPLQSIEVDVKLQAEKKVEITANGVHEINADSGYNGIVKVVANVDIPNEEQYLGEYIDGTIYKTGAIVSYNGNIYICIKDLDEMQDPTFTDYWEMLNEESEGETDSALPIEVSTEAEMTALLESGEVGGVYKYTGTTGTYENGALYVLEVSE